MANAELKTKKNEQSVEGFLETVADQQKRQDSLTVLKMMKKAAHADPKMWGDSIIGFGSTHFKYASGRELEWFLLGFSPRKQALTLYLELSLVDQSDLLEKLGKHKTGRGCLYINSLSEVNLDVLQQMMERTVGKQAG
jgi:Domain of unknown function (DU1801)